VKPLEICVPVIPNCEINSGSVMFDQILPQDFQSLSIVRGIIADQPEVRGRYP
jgi:hypothetical protein